MHEELAADIRVVAETPGFAAIAAYAGRFNHETWVLPKEHASRFETLSDSQAAELAELMKRLLQAFDRVLGEPAYNWYLHAPPLRSAELPHYHWHLELIPRTARPAGFEWGSGCFLTSVSAETAAAKLRGGLLMNHCQPRRRNSQPAENNQAVANPMAPIRCSQWADCTPSDSAAWRMRGP